MIALSSPGIFTILVFKSTGAKLFHMTPDDTGDWYGIQKNYNRIEIDRKIIVVMLTEIFVYIIKAILSMIYCQKLAKS